MLKASIRLREEQPLITRIGISSIQIAAELLIKYYSITVGSVPIFLNVSYGTGILLLRSERSAN